VYQNPLKFPPSKDSPFHGGKSLSRVSLYVSDDVGGRIYRIVYHGGSEGGAANVTACPSTTAPAGNPVEVAAEPPEGTHPDAGAAATLSLPVPEGATREMVALGERIYRGQVGGAACTGCHLMGKKWLWSDGSYSGITKTIAEGVSQPKRYRSPMPPMGGGQLTPDQISALAAYVWGLSHHASPNRN
jgi:mono/diheme cytochrome c family protein